MSNKVMNETAIMATGTRGVKMETLGPRGNKIGIDPAVILSIILILFRLNVLIITMHEPVLQLNKLGKHNQQLDQIHT